MTPQNMNSSRAINKLNFEDVLCPICTTIYIEPVCLPCKHRVCRLCLEKTVENNTLTCPICRTRIGSFLRLSKTSGKLVDEKLWKKMKEQFPSEIKKKQNGEEDGISEIIFKAEGRHNVIAEKGSIKEEFEEMIKKIKSHQQQSRLAEEVASEKLAQEIMEQEIMEENKRKRRQEEIVKADMIYIQNLILCEKTESTSSASENSKTSTASSELENENSVCCHGRDSITAELRHFTPICIMPKTPPKRLPNGKIHETKLLRPVNMALSVDDKAPSCMNRRALRRSSLKVYSNNFVRTKSDDDSAQEEFSTIKDDESERSSPEELETVSPENVEILPEEIIKTQELIQSRIEQEKQDLAFAIKLQAELDKIPFSQKRHGYMLRSAHKNKRRNTHC